jgi:hypothetical protein
VRAITKVTHAQRLELPMPCARTAQGLDYLSHCNSAQIGHCVRTTLALSGALASFASELETIAFNVKYPGGLEDYVEAMGGAGISRLG